ncbi:hypothetical protein [Sulfuricella denitrificans]|nr:hypothetical protein [Sulfuricella denitrificans]
MAWRMLSIEGRGALRVGQGGTELRTHFRVAHSVAFDQRPYRCQP